jgi:formate/nitrite transporter FocA (FNT family)
MDQTAGASSPHLDEDEQDQAASHAAPRALVIHEIVRAEGEEALKRQPAALIWSALAAGLSMGFSFLGQALLHACLPDEPWRPSIDSLGYSVGFIIVILGRQQLFTESTLTAVLPVLTRPNIGSLGALLRLWGIVLVANILGAWIFAGLLTIPGVFRPDVTASLASLAVQTVQSPFAPMFFRSVFAGWLIAMMVWLLPSARSARLWTVLLITYVVSLGHLSHIIAGSVEAAYAVLTHTATLQEFALSFMLPTLLGNIVGGVALVALLNHAAIAPDIQDSMDRSEQ